MSHQNAPGQAGFTLVEALVSLFVFGLIAAGATGLLIQAARAQLQAAEAHEALARLQTARSLLSGDLAQMAPRAPRSALNAGQGPIFVGGDEEVGLAFVRSAMVGDGGSLPSNRLSYVAYAIENDRLLRRVRTDLIAPAAPAEDDQILLEGAKNLKFAFFDGIVWHDQWIAMDGGLPRAVALTGEVPRYGPIRIAVLTAETWP